MLRKFCLTCASIFLVTSAISANPVWQEITVVPWPTCVAVDSDGKIYAGVSTGLLVSSDTGATWQTFIEDPEFASPFVITASTVDNNLFVAVEMGIYRTANGGLTWDYLGDSTSGAYAIGMRNDGLLITAGSFGIARSFDNGDSWERVFQTVGPLTNGIAFSSDGSIFVATLLDGLMRSEDDGATWQLVGESFWDFDDILEVVADTVNGFVYATDYHLVWMEPTYSHTYRSADNGDSWVSIDSALDLNRAMFVDSRQNLIIGRHPAAYSENHGGSWNDLSAGLVFEDGFTDFIEVTPGLLFGISNSLYKLQLWSPENCCSGNTGNVNCDAEGNRNLADITRLIDHVYLSKTPLCCQANGNVDGSIDGKVNLSDITRLIDHVYLSKAETAPCL